MGIKGTEMKPKAYIFDIDGTIADCSHRLHFIAGEHKDWDAFYTACKNDRAIPDTVMLLKMLSIFNCDILFITGRPEYTREQTRQWLLNVVDYNTDPRIKMRKDGDHRPDYVAKREIYEQEIKDKYDVVGVFEDRDSCVKMWRELGLTCFQVADGSY